MSKKVFNSTLAKGAIDYINVRLHSMEIAQTTEGSDKLLELESALDEYFTREIRDMSLCKTTMSLDHGERTHNVGLNNTATPENGTVDNKTVDNEEPANQESTATRDEKTENGQIPCDRQLTPVPESERVQDYHVSRQWREDSCNGSEPLQNECNGSEVVHQKQLFPSDASPTFVESITDIVKNVI